MPGLDRAVEEAVEVEFRPFSFSAICARYYNEAVCQRQNYTNDNCRETKAPKERNIEEGGKRETLKGRKT